MPASSLPFPCFFFTHTAPTEIYTLSLHDALPILNVDRPPGDPHTHGGRAGRVRSAGREIRLSRLPPDPQDRKSTRLNSSHRCISYAGFCLKKNSISIS